MKKRNGLPLLGRRINQEVFIGDEIRIIVVRVDGTGNVTLGIDAPRDIPVMRAELVADDGAGVG